MLADERYGIESDYVREVYPLKDYTPLPCWEHYLFLRELSFFAI